MAVVAALAVVGIVLARRWPPSPEEIAIREAVYRYMFAHNGSGLQSKACAYYLGTSDGWAELPSGPSNWFVEKMHELLALLAPGPDTSPPGNEPHPSHLARFRRHTPPIRPLSRCALYDVMTGIQDRQTRQRGLVFLTGRIKWISRTVVDVEGGYHEGGLSSSGSIYRLVKRHGRWVVVKDTMKWIS